MTDLEDILARPADPPDLQVRYGGHPDQVADVWVPRSGPAPLVLVIHGGFWRARYDRSHAAPQCAALASAGYLVASLEYRRPGSSGGGGWPGTFDDVAAAVEAVPDLVAAAASGLTDAQAYVLLGHSAGGHLALWVASRHRLPAGHRWARSTPDHRLRGVISLAGVVDLATAARRGLGAGAVRDLLGGEPADVPDRYAATDPALLLPAGPPVRLIHGMDDTDVPVEISESYARAADDSRVRTAQTTLTVLPETGHYDLIDPWSRAWPVVLDKLARLAESAPDPS